jgi:hypothetical protein
MDDKNVLLGLVAVAVIAGVCSLGLALMRRQKRKAARAQRGNANHTRGFESATPFNDDGSPRIYSTGLPTRVYSAGISGYGKGHKPVDAPSHSLSFIAAVALADTATQDDTRRNNAPCTDTGFDSSSNNSNSQDCDSSPID